MLSKLGFVVLIGQASAANWTDCVSSVGSQKGINVNDKDTLKNLANNYQAQEIEVCYDSLNLIKSVQLRAGIWDSTKKSF